MPGEGAFSATVAPRCEIDSCPASTPGTLGDVAVTAPGVGGASRAAAGSRSSRSAGEQQWFGDEAIARLTPGAHEGGVWADPCRREVGIALERTTADRRPVRPVGRVDVAEQPRPVAADDDGRGVDRRHADLQGAPDPQCGVEPRPPRPVSEAATRATSSSRAAACPCRRRTPSSPARSSTTRALRPWRGIRAARIRSARRPARPAGWRRSRRARGRRRAAGRPTPRPRRSRCRPRGRARRDAGKLGVLGGRSRRRGRLERHRQRKRRLDRVEAGRGVAELADQVEGFGAESRVGDHHGWSPTTAPSTSTVTSAIGCPARSARARARPSAAARGSGRRTGAGGGPRRPERRASSGTVESGDFVAAEGGDRGDRLVGRSMVVTST